MDGNKVQTLEAEVLVENHSDFVRQVTLNRAASANSLIPSTIAALTRVVTEAYTDSTRILVLRGMGKHFSSGANQAQNRRNAHAAERIESVLQIEALLQLLWRAPFVTVALVQGAALGAGCDIVVCCDYRVGGPQALMGFPGFRMLGVSLGTRRLAEVIGGTAAFDMVLRARRIDREEAMRLGLISHACEPEEFETFLNEVCTAISDVNKASISILREATRGISGGGGDLDRVARSLAVSEKWKVKP